MSLPSELIEILACPRCKQPVKPDERHENLICRFCRVAYPVRDGIPVMLLDEAQPLEGEM
ncbi:MAG TPA: Trm112 family protein [Desulfuromonadales bacterium]|nr:Trm112 family protein [Desulfuromonadales bacterium]